VRWYVVLALVGAIWSSGCGFHLRGGLATSAIESIYVVADPEIAITGDLERTLAKAGVAVRKDRKEARVTLTVLGDRSRRQTLSVTEQARTAEYEITREISYRAERADGAVLLDDRTITGTRVYRIDRSNLAGSSQEERLLEQELAADLIAQIVRSLDAAGAGGT
jgi:outer membrane lipopolysaccharide assembly protein LptE/RlpB